MNDHDDKIPLSKDQPASPQVQQSSTGAHSSSLRKLGVVALASLLYLLLLDAAVETFLSESSLRWIVGGTVAGYIVLSVLLWRRLSWATKASASLLVLLGLLTFSAWRLEGSSSGITMLRQPTLTLLASATALGILLAGWILVRWKFLPWPARAVLGLLAIYGIAAFAVGIVTSIPYPVLLRGGSLWQRAPFWLQGAFIGAVILVPAALLSQFVTSVAWIRSGQLHAWCRQVLALGLSLAITVTGLWLPSGFAVAPMSAPAGASPFGPTPWSLLPEPASDLKTALEGMRRLQARTNPETFDVSAAAKLIGNDVQKILAFVRDDFCFDPYRGSLRGAQGTLMARGGNAIDRSLLMRALLGAHGYPARLVYGKLSDGDAQRLLSRATQPLRLPAPNPLTVDGAAQVSGLPLEEMRRLTEAAETKGREIRRILQERVRRDTANIERLLQKSQIQLQPAPTPTVDDVRTHVWVQTEIDGEWRDLDPSFSDSKVGQRFAEPEGEIPMEPLPDEWVHALRLRVLVAYGGSGAVQENEVLNAHLRVPDLVGQAMMLGFAPLDGGEPPSPETANAFRPVLVVGSQQSTGSTVYLDAAKAQAGGLGGMFGTALSEEESQPLDRAWLEITLEGPGLTASRATRTIVRSPEGTAADPSVRVEQAREQIVSLYQFVVAGGALSPDWLAASYVSFLEQFQKPSIDTMEMIPLDLFNLVNAATRPEMGELVGHPKGIRRYYRQPLVVAQRLRFRSEPGGRTVFVKSVDIIYNRLEVLSGDPVAAIRQGVLETHLERLIMEGLEVGNTTVIFERSRAPILVLRSGEVKTLEHSNFGTEAKQRIIEDLTAGYAVIIPAERVEVVGTPTIGWWRVRPQGGETLGRMESGEGQAMSERVGYMIPSAYSTGAGLLCSKLGKTSGICNPCLIAGAGLLGMGLGLAWWVQWGSAIGGLIAFGLGAYGAATKGPKCVDWFLKQMGVQ